jgi:hypothetical protein
MTNLLDPALENLFSALRYGWLFAIVIFWVYVYPVEVVVFRRGFLTN